MIKLIQEIHIFFIILKHLSSYADLCNVSQWFFILHQHLSKLQALFRVDPHYISEQKDPVRSVAHLLCSCFLRRRKGQTNIQISSILHDQP